MAAFLYIVARRRHDLYESLRREFELEPGVEVVFDRRQGARRQGGAPGVEERRRRPDRRIGQMVQAQLREVGCAVVSRD
jgi:hypothetical protein